MTSTNETCALCNSDTIITTSNREIVDRHGVRHMYPVKMYECKGHDCGFEFFLPNLLTENLKVRREVEAQIPDYISPDQVLAVREIYDLSISDAEQIFNVSAHTWDKYELSMGKMPSIELTQILKRVLVDHEFFVDLLLASRPLKT